MSANLNVNNGKTSMFSVKEIPWHGRGQILENCPTSEEGIKLAGLDFEVGLCGLKGIIPVEEKSITADITTNKGTYRKDNNHIFGIVGNRYEPVQNTEAFSFFDSIVGSGAAIYETAGCLGDGETVFITAKLPDDIIIGNPKFGDIANCYLLLTMAHDGSAAIKVMFTPIRVVCNNTLNMALSSDRWKISFKHTRNAHDKMKSAERLLQVTYKTQQTLSKDLTMMSNTVISDEQIIKYIDYIFLSNEELHRLAVTGIHSYGAAEISTKKINIIADCLAYTFKGAGQDMPTSKNTVFGAYSGITGYFQNVKSFDTDGEFNPDKKLNTNLLGNNYEVMQKAYDLAFGLTFADNIDNVLTIK
jgi:phage/plasmid-like protein (TIGR03299 family)